MIARQVEHFGGTPVRISRTMVHDGRLITSRELCGRRLLPSPTLETARLIFFDCFSPIVSPFPPKE
jgi:hypothetical protein